MYVGSTSYSVDQAAATLTIASTYVSTPYLTSGTTGGICSSTNVVSGAEFAS